MKITIASMGKGTLDLWLYSPGRARVMGSMSRRWKPRCGARLTYRSKGGSIYRGTCAHAMGLDRHALHNAQQQEASDAHSPSSRRSPDTRLMQLTEKKGEASLAMRAPPSSFAGLKQRTSPEIEHRRESRRTLGMAAAISPRSPVAGAGLGRAPTPKPANPPASSLCQT